MNQDELIKELTDVWIYCENMELDRLVREQANKLGFKFKSGIKYNDFLTMQKEEGVYHNLISGELSFDPKLYTGSTIGLNIISALDFISWFDAKETKRERLLNERAKNEEELLCKDSDGKSLAMVCTNGNYIPAQEINKEQAILLANWILEMES